MDKADVDELHGEVRALAGSFKASIDDFATEARKNARRARADALRNSLLLCVLVLVGFGGIVGGWELHRVVDQTGRAVAETKARGIVNQQLLQHDQQLLEDLSQLLASVKATAQAVADATSPAAQQRTAAQIQGLIDAINRDTQASLAQVERDVAALLKVAAPARLADIPPPRASPVTLAPSPPPQPSRTTSTTRCAIGLNGRCLVP